MEIMGEGNKTIGKKGNSNFRWSKPMSNFFLKIMAEKATNGMKSGQGFKNQAFVAAVKAINEEFPTSQVTEANVINHLRTLKGKWSQIRKLKGLSGVGWNEREKIITMDESEYRTYIQAHPKDEPFLNKPIEMYEEMALACGNDAATGEFSKSLHVNSAPLGSQMDVDSPNHCNDGTHAENFENITPQSHSIHSGSPTESRNINTTPKRKRGIENETVAEVAKSIVRVADAIAKDKDLDFAGMLYDAIMALEPSFPTTKLSDAYDYLLAKESLARGFIKRDISMREIWMRGFISNFNENTNN